MNRLMLMIFVTLLFSGGCNAVYFYETSKASFTIEARPDPTAPVTGSIGVKHRIAAVVPSTKPTTPEAKRLQDEAAREDAVVAMSSDRATTQRASERADELRAAAEELNRDAAGNALSVLSSFRFHKHPPPKGSIISQVTIDATLITGNAARQIKREQIDDTVRALNGVQPTVQRYSLASLVHLRRALEELAKESPNGDAANRVSGLDAAAQFLPPTYPIDVYEADQQGKLTRTHKQGDPVDRARFTDVTSYLEELAASRATLTKAAELSESNTTVVIDGKDLPATADRMVANGLRHLAARTAEVQVQAATDVSKSPAIRAETKALGLD